MSDYYHATVMRNTIDPKTRTLSLEPNLGMPQWSSHIGFHYKRIPVGPPGTSWDLFGFFRICATLKHCICFSHRGEDTFSRRFKACFCDLQTLYFVSNRGVHTLTDGQSSFSFRNTCQEKVWRPRHIRQILLPTQEMHTRQVSLSKPIKLPRPTCLPENKPQLGVSTD